MTFNPDKTINELMEAMRLGETNRADIRYMGLKDWLKGGPCLTRSQGEGLEFLIRLAVNLHFRLLEAKKKADPLKDYLL